MDFNQYQVKARTTAVYPSAFKILYPALGLGGETGETLEKIKKMIRDGDFEPEYFTCVNIDEDPILSKQREEIKKELGDILWYLANLATDFGLNLSDIAKANLEKLLDRKARGVIKGSGDNR